MIISWKVVLCIQLQCLFHMDGLDEDSLSDEAIVSINGVAAPQRGADSDGNVSLRGKGIRAGAQAYEVQGPPVVAILFAARLPSVSGDVIITRQAPKELREWVTARRLHHHMVKPVLPLEAMLQEQAYVVGAAFMASFELETGDSAIERPDSRGFRPMSLLQAWVCESSC